LTGQNAVSVCVKKSVVRSAALEEFKIVLSMRPDQKSGLFDFNFPNLALNPNPNLFIRRRLRVGLRLG
jgi:hypothetical protein